MIQGRCNALVFSASVHKRVKTSMPRPPKAAGDAERRAREVIATTDDIDMLRAAQSVLMPLQGMTLEQTAEALGRDKFWVSRTRNRFIRGEPPQSTHGGRRNAYFNSEQEHVLVRDVLAERYHQNGIERQSITLRDLLKSRLDEATRSSVADSTITDILDRYVGRLVPGFKWTEIDGYQHYLQTLAALEVAIHKQRERFATNRREIASRALGQPE